MGDGFQTIKRDSGRQRDVAIDVIRGLCIIEMTQTHLSAGSDAWRATHFQPWVDGASGFALMSGLVLGRVYARKRKTEGPELLRAKQYKRIALLYFSHVAIVSFAILVDYLTSFRTNSGLGATSPTTISFWVLTLQVNPGDVHMLSMYLVLVTITLIWVPALAAGRWPIVVTTSILVWAIGSATSWGTLPNRPDGQSFFNIACWQLLFTGAFVAGWNWPTARRWISSGTALITASIVGIGVAGLAAGLPDGTVPDALYDKSQCGIGRILLAWCTFIVLYHVCRFLVRKAPVVLSPLTVIGSRTLACFIFLCVADLSTPLLIGPESSTTAAQVTAFIVAGAMYPVARFRGWAGGVARSARWPRRPHAVIPDNAGPHHQPADN